MTAVRRALPGCLSGLLLTATAACAAPGDGPPVEAGPGPTSASATPVSPSPSATGDATSTQDVPPTEDSAQPTAGAVPVPLAGPRAVDPAHVPVRLAVAAAGIDVPLVELGIAADGTLAVPTDYQEVGWFDGGPPPGDTGPAVIAGHVDSRSGPAPFYRLREVAPGDAVEVTRADGAVVTFTVDGVEQYPKDAFPTAAVYGPVPGPALRLVTCGGSFDRTSGHYRDNVVVYAS